MNMILIGGITLIIFIIFLVGGIVLGKKFFGRKEITEDQQFQR